MAAVKQFSAKQKTAMTWWANPRYQEYDAIICDGAVRSGKTLSMGMGFFLWAMRRFSGEQFALCGKTIVSLRRNVLHEILPKVTALGFHCEEKRSENLVIVRSGGRENRFYLFGGYDEGSAALIQGVTLAGVLFDEAALMPRSFVEQASARCSVSGSKLWFNCNPEGPMHWFYREWILRAEERGALYLHFTMDDNPSLSPRIRARYEKAYSGTFYRRFILGEWTAAKGLIYDFFTPLNPEAGHPYGVSMLRSMPYLTGLLLKIYDAMGKNWDRCGNVRFAVTYRPQDGELDRGAAQERAEQIAEEWSRAMQEGRNGSVRDFVSVGDVSIKAIGADNQILDSETPVRQILEQLVAKTGLPPFMLGLSWSSTERMSSQQADMLTSEITALRRTLEPVIERVCTLWLRMHGYGCRAVVDWEDINLQDEVEEAKAALYLQQARKLRQENDEAEGK